MTDTGILDVDLLAFERGSEAQRRAVIDGVRRSLATGFVYTTHDLPAALLDEAYGMLARFFSLPAAAKAHWEAPASHGQTGYTGLLVETAAASDAADWKEMLNWGAEVPAAHPLRVRYPHRYADQVLPEADVIFVCAPHTLMSNKMVGAREFELMKKDAYFIAVSRGGLYDMGGLVKALDSKRLAGAGVDVTDPEPLPKGHPLWKFPNVVITPHVAGRSDKDRARMVGTIKENIQRFVDGRPLVNVVDKQKGY